MKLLMRIAFLLGLVSCHTQPNTSVLVQSEASFSPDSLVIMADTSVKKISGQVWYFPVYLQIPYLKDTKFYTLSAFIAIHNTDFYHPISISRVLLFNNDGKMIQNFISKPVVLNPLAASHFFVPENSSLGTGANFILEWTSNHPVTEPLIESVMTGLQNNQGVTFSSTGRIVRERK